MKKLFLLIILNSSILIVNCFAQQYGWVNIGQNIPGDSLYHDLSDLYFINDNEGWITSSSHSEIYHTTDGGQTFEVQTTMLPVNAIWMLNANEGYAGGQSGFVYRTSNGGNNWNYQGTITTTLTDLTFPPQPADTGYACGYNGKIYSITSGAVSPMNSGMVGNLNAITFPSTTEGWACGGNVINHFVSGIWSLDQSYTSGGYNGIYFVDNQNGWAVGDVGKIIHTTDGENWDAQTNPDLQSRSLFNLIFLNVDEGWAVGANGVTLHTTNGGTTWTVEGNGFTTAFLTGVHFTSSTNGYITGGNKTLLKYTLLSDVAEELTQPADFKLEQNYPNPFNPTTKLSFVIGHTSFVTLKVYDVLGNEVATLINEEKSAGRYKVEFDADQLSSGIYFYQLKAGDFIQTKKMVLIR